MNKLDPQPFKLITGVVFLLLMIKFNSVSADTIETKVTETDQLPSLDLLLYLGEFQDRDGTLLEPVHFDKSLELDKQKHTNKKQRNGQNEKSTTKITATKKEDDDEKSQP